MFADVLLPLSLTLIMGSLGLTLTPADFRRVVTAPKGVGIGLGNLLLISPLLAFLVADVYGLAATLAVGVVLLGASPGGTTANLLTHLARGDVALSVSMTAVSSVASVITVPLFLSLGAEYFDAQDISDEISMPGVAARVFLITIVPLSIGMLIRARRTEWALRNMERARRIALIAFVIVVAGAVASEFETISDAFGEIAAAVITLNILAMGVSFLIARAARLSNRQSTAIAMELGVHNTTVALAVATSVDDDLAGPAAVYGLFMFLTAGLFARFMARRNAETEPDDHAEASVEVEAPAERVWRAVSTGEGLSAWFAPATVDGDRVEISMGALGTVHGRVVASERSRRFAFAEAGWLDGAPPLITEFEIQDRGARRSEVKVTNRLQGPATAQAREALAATEASWAPYLAALRLHLAGQEDPETARVDVTAPCGETWGVLREALTARGRRPEGAPGLAGRVEFEGERQIVLSLDGPAPGHAVVAIRDGQDGPLLDVQAWLRGPGAAQAAAREEAAWRAWLAARRARA